MTRALALFLLLATPALSHDWFSDKTNPETGQLCCNHTDCLPRAEEDVWRDADEYVVRHFDGRIYRIPARQAQPTQDKQGRIIACIWQGKLRCIFIPLNG